jgi:3-oxoadipate enol-lactonase
MKSVRIQDTEIAYRVDGTQDPARPWIVMAHALGSDHRMWDAQVAFLAPRYRILRYDLRGHGASALAPGETTLERLADELKLLLDELYIAQVHFVGLSLGGMIGQQFALRHQVRLRSLTLADTASRAAPDAPAQIEARIQQARRAGMGGLVPATMERWFTAGFRARHPEVVAVVGQVLRDTPVDGYAACARVVARIALTSRLAVIRCPTLILVGDQDRGTPPAEAELIAQAIHGSRLVTLRDAAHLSNLEQAEAFNASLERFLIEH